MKVQLKVLRAKYAEEHLLTPLTLQDHTYYILFFYLLDKYHFKGHKLWKKKRKKNQRRPWGGWLLAVFLQNFKIVFLVYKFYELLSP